MVDEPDNGPLPRQVQPHDELPDQELLDRYRQGDRDAATALYFRYAHRLEALSREKCSHDLASRLDADDIVQSVFRSFFRVARNGLYRVPAGADLWRLLLVIALNKIRAQGAYHRAAKRDVRLTCHLDTCDQAPTAARRRDADPAQAFLELVAAEALENLPEHVREMARLRLEGYEVAEIAEKVGRSKRTVERLLQECRKQLGSLPHGDDQLLAGGARRDGP
jgi:RNA polymerase sigma-70 factor (ECF subfamily)